MLSVTIWDCTGDDPPLLYRLQVYNTCTIAELKVLIEHKRNELGRLSQKSFLIYHGNQLITKFDMELLSFISDPSKISNCGITFTIYDENIITCNIRVMRGVSCGNIRYVPILMNLFKAPLQIEIFDQENVGQLKQEILKQFASEKLKTNCNLGNTSMILLHKGNCLDDDSALKSIYSTSICHVDCTFLQVIRKGICFKWFLRKRTSQ